MKEWYLISLRLWQRCIPCPWRHSRRRWWGHARSTLRDRTSNCSNFAASGDPAETSTGDRTWRTPLSADTVLLHIKSIQIKLNYSFSTIQIFFFLNVYSCIIFKSVAQHTHTMITNYSNQTINYSDLFKFKWIIIHYYNKIIHY